jgi:hypothetical protein
MPGVNSPSGSANPEAVGVPAADSLGDGGALRLGGGAALWLAVGPGAATPPDLGQIITATTATTATAAKAVSTRRIEVFKLVNLRAGHQARR